MQQHTTGIYAYMVLVCFFDFFLFYREKKNLKVYIQVLQRTIYIKKIRSVPSTVQTTCTPYFEVNKAVAEPEEASFNTQPKQTD